MRLKIHKKRKDTKTTLKLYELASHLYPFFYKKKEKLKFLFGVLNNAERKRKQSNFNPFLLLYYSHK